MMWLWWLLSVPAALLGYWVLGRIDGREPARPLRSEGYRPRKRINARTVRPTKGPSAVRPATQNPKRPARPWLAGITVQEYEDALRPSATKRMVDAVNDAKATPIPAVDPHDKAIRSVAGVRVRNCAELGAVLRASEGRFVNVEFEDGSPLAVARVWWSRLDFLSDDPPPPPPSRDWRHHDELRESGALAAMTEAEYRAHLEGLGFTHPSNAHLDLVRPATNTIDLDDPSAIPVLDDLAADIGKGQQVKALLAHVGAAKGAVLGGGGSNAGAIALLSMLRRRLDPDASRRATAKIFVDLNPDPPPPPPPREQHGG